MENTTWNLFVMGAEVSLSDCVLRGAQYGVDMQSAAVVKMSGCVIENHTTSGIWMREGDSISVSDCQFTENVSDQGGGIRAESGTVIALGCTFTDNHATNGSGGAIFVDNASLTASGCTFIENTCDSNDLGFGGGAIGLYYSDAEIAYSIFRGNNLDLSSMWLEGAPSDSITRPPPSITATSNVRIPCRSIRWTSQLTAA